MLSSLSNSDDEVPSGTQRNSFSRRGVGDGDVDGLGVDGTHEFIEAVQPGQHVGLAAQARGFQQVCGERGTQRARRSEEPAEGGEEHLFVSELLGTERSDQSEHVVDTEVVREAFVGDGVGDEGVADRSDARKPALKCRAV